MYPLCPSRLKVKRVQESCACLVLEPWSKQAKQAADQGSSKASVAQEWAVLAQHYP